MERGTEQVGAPTVIVGAGPTGIAAALGLGAAPSIVLERRPEVGGLCGSLELDGALFDLGGHAFTTPHPAVRELVFAALPMVEQRREARCWVDGQLIDYPFQRHFGALCDRAVAEECARGLRETDGRETALAPHFEEYLLRRFGTGVATHFMLPYNRKLWARDLRRMDTGWVRERVAAPPTAPVDAAPADAGRAVDAASAGTGSPPARQPLSEETRVAYPAEGGYVEIVRALARDVRDVRLDDEVTRIDLASRTLATSRSGALAFDRLIATIPPAALLALIDDAPAEPRADAAALESMSLALVLAVVEGPVATTVQRIYVADPRILAHKIVLNHTSTDALRARPRHAVVSEIAFSAEKPLPADVERRAVEDLVAVGVVGHAGAVRTTRVLTIRHAYPVPTLDRVARMTAIRAWLEPRGVFLAGRLGEWDYINADECIRRGLALGRALAAGGPMTRTATA
ncbi:MAG TPA: FAD-dependent oxidoreductase [Candidatus Binatia bacterium]